MNTATAIKTLRVLHECELETDNMKEARAIEVAIAALEAERWDQRCITRSMKWAGIGGLMRLKVLAHLLSK